MVVALQHGSPLIPGLVGLCEARAAKHCDVRCRLVVVGDAHLACGWTSGWSRACGACGGCWGIGLALHGDAGGTKGIYSTGWGGIRQRRLERRPQGLESLWGLQRVALCICRPRHLELQATRGALADARGGSRPGVVGLAAAVRGHAARPRCGEQPLRVRSLRTRKAGRHLNRALRVQLGCAAAYGVGFDLQGWLRHPRFAAGRLHRRCAEPRVEFEVAPCEPRIQAGEGSQPPEP
mmetsp:Transcript_5718/g.15739  ORF Transcript_5718/g.15739 Transcript_5718/m.15739 type:complete len:236 (+) Transcript_5718:695-1402(+)